MQSELKVYNSFGELNLHLRLSRNNAVDLRVIDGTPEMRAAIARLRGLDFDRTVAKDNEFLRLTAEWGSAEYLSKLSRYFVENFGWTTKIVESEPISTFVASGNSVSFRWIDYYETPSMALPVDDDVFIANVVETSPGVVPEVKEINSYAATA